MESISWFVNTQERLHKICDIELIFISCKSSCGIESLIHCGHACPLVKNMIWWSMTHLTWSHFPQICRPVLMKSVSLNSQMSICPVQHTDLIQVTDMNRKACQKYGRDQNFIKTGISWDTTKESREQEVFITVMQAQARSYMWVSQDKQRSQTCDPENSDVARNSFQWVEEMY